MITIAKIFYPQNTRYEIYAWSVCLLKVYKRLNGSKFVHSTVLLESLHVSIIEYIFHLSFFFKHRTFFTPTDLVDILTQSTVVLKDAQSLLKCIVFCSYTHFLRGIFYFHSSAIQFPYFYDFAFLFTPVSHMPNRLYWI